MPSEAKGDRDRVLVTDTDLVRVTDTLGDLELGFLDRDKVRVTEPVRDTVRVQGSVPLVRKGVLERVLVTDIVLVLGFPDLDLVRVTEPVLLTVRVKGKVPIVLAGDLERVLVTDTVLDIGFLDRVTETLRVRVPTPVGRVLDTVGDLELGLRDLERVRVTEPVLVMERVRVTETVAVLEFIRRLALPPLRCWDSPPPLPPPSPPVSRSRRPAPPLPPPTMEEYPTSTALRDPSP